MNMASPGVFSLGLVSMAMGMIEAQRTLVGEVYRCKVEGRAFVKRNSMQDRTVSADHMVGGNVEAAVRAA